MDGRSRNRIRSAIIELANKQRKDPREQIPPAAGSGTEETLSPGKSNYIRIIRTDKVKIRNAKVSGS